MKRDERDEGRENVECVLRGRRRAWRSVACCLRHTKSLSVTCYNQWEEIECPEVAFGDHRDASGKFGEGSCYGCEGCVWGFRCMCGAQEQVGGVNFRGFEKCER